MTNNECTLAEAVESLLGQIASGTFRNLKRVPYDMISDYTRDGWVVVERHETYATLEKIGAAE